jgi:hypothetical protein
MLPTPVAFIEFTDGVRRPVIEEPSGRQYVLDGDGEPVYGIWAPAPTKLAFAFRPC